MIPRANIVEWASRVHWPTLDQVEQDLVLAGVIVEIAKHPYLGEELVFRGGTCLHKFHLAPALRYSEDLDYVRRSADGVGELFDAVRVIGGRLGMEVQTAVSMQPKVFLRAPFESGRGTMRIKIEVNTHERSPARPLIRHPFTVSSPWFTGHAEVQTFRPEELVATKLRALYQRSKGRDLFDLWLARTRLGLSSAAIVECFAPYRPEGYTPRLAEQNLRRKLGRSDFRNDLRPLVSEWPADFDIDAAGQMIIDDVLALIS
ncbi:MAG: nucleotidyl transferase AbiEii/AbiGii toxin family protein [Actinomycetota bacterium]|nr:nucleotidyl transferase AbiEii/AbiGii toxin family protein [Actinomycetota bacterium]